MQVNVNMYAHFLYLIELKYTMFDVFLQEFLKDAWTEFKDRLHPKNGRDLTLSFYVILSLKQLW